VKPSNVIFVNGRPKLADIGLVTDASDQCSIVGTEGYLPPEGPGTPQADIFALGKVLYEAATGLDRRSFPELPEDLRAWPEHQAVVELNEIVLRACAREAAGRYATCQEMHDELERLGAGRSVKSRRILQQRVRLVRKAALAAVMLILALAGTVFLWRMATGYDSSTMVIGGEEKVVGSYKPSAMREYELGLHGLRSGTPEGCQQALEHLGQAIKIEPKFVEAYARLFETYLMPEDHALPAIGGQTEKLNELAGTLQSLAPTNADTHAAVAIVKFLNQWKWAEAEGEFKEALKSGPSCRMALTYYGYFLTRLARSDSASRHLKRADALYPASADIAKLLGHCEFAKRNFDAALDHYLKAEELNSSYPSAYYWAGRACMGLTNYFEAFRQLQKGEVLGGSNEAATAKRYDSYREAVRKDPDHPAQASWSTLIQDQKPTEGTSSVPYLIAARYVRVGDTNQALKWLKIGLEKRDRAMGTLLFDECWDPYHREKWFKEVVKEVGLEPWQ
jgi:tetratricopeptide (TPR) repeat protein